MAEDAENQMLRMLRDIRSKQDDHDKRFGLVDQELKDLRKSIEDWQETTSTGVGFAAHANLRTQALEREIAELKRRVAILEKTH